MAVQAGVYGESSGRVWFSDVSCYGNETSIYECQTTIFGGSSECDHAQDVGVFCWDGKTDYISKECNTITIQRLTTFNRNIYFVRTVVVCFLLFSNTLSFHDIRSSVS